MPVNEEQILLSAEKNFIHYEAFNKGFITIPRMVERCIGLSLQARGVYSYIATFIFEHGRSAFPSLHNIAIGCGIAVSSAVRHIDELVLKGFILRVRRGQGKTNDYFIVDVDKVPLLRVSEMLWEALYGVVRGNRKCRWEEAEAAFRVMLQRLKSLQVCLQRIPANEETRGLIARDLERILKGEEPDMAFIPKRPGKVAPTAQPTAPQVRTPFGKQSIPFTDRDMDTWTVSNFVEYFYRKYLNTTGNKQSGSLGMHQGIMKRTLKQMEDESKHELRVYIDAFFEMGYDIQTIEWFGKNGRVGEIRTYLTEGKKPFYLTKESGSFAAPLELEQQVNTGLSDAALARLLGGDAE